MQVNDEDRPEVQFSFEEMPALPPGTMEDSDAQGQDEPIRIEFDENVDKAERADYIAAAAIGASTGVLNIFWQKRFDLSEAHTWGKDKVESFVFDVAKGAGFKPDGKDLKDAIRFLEDMFPLASDRLTPEFGGGLQHHLRDFAHHPSPLGLLMSILAQFTGKGYGTDTSGAFVILDLPADALVGKTFPEKLFYGTIIWAMHLASDMAGSSRALGEGTGIPGPILSLLKELSALPVFKKEGADNAFSKWISKLFNGMLIRDADGNPIRIDFRTELGVADQGLSQVKSVIANECLVRGYYFLSRLKDELSCNNVQSLKDFDRIDVKRVIPTDERSLIRMLTISSSVFVLANLGIAVGKAAVTSKGDRKKFAGGILLNLNFVGIGRMAMAIASDSKYIAEDLKDYFNKRAEEMNAFTENFKLLRLNDREARLLFSYQVIAVKKDIELTKDDKHRAAKSAWLEEFKTRQADQMGCDAATYFIDEASVAEEMQKAFDEDDSSWPTLLAMELWLFKPYYSFDADWKERLKGVKYKNDYVGKDFLNAQDVIDKKKDRWGEENLQALYRFAYRQQDQDSNHCRGHSCGWHCDSGYRVCSRPGHCTRDCRRSSCRSLWRSSYQCESCCRWRRIACCGRLGNGGWYGDNHRKRSLAGHGYHRRRRACQRSWRTCRAICPESVRAAAHSLSTAPQCRRLNKRVHASRERPYRASPRQMPRRY
ncbi:hypothetical protein BPORC_0534 [Bifidobacterium porcinum]|nr:hypothetical protein BPORC_0534 [Bifidobacterium porcinum]